MPSFDEKVRDDCETCYVFIHKVRFMTKMVRNLDMLRNFEHVMKLDETCKSLIVINQDLTKKESVN